MIKRKCDKCGKYSYSSVEGSSWKCAYCGEILSPDKNSIPLPGAKCCETKGEGSAYEDTTPDPSPRKPHFSPQETPVSLPKKTPFPSQGRGNLQCL
ncbi:MAG: hypothetical protein KO464_02325 [Candidatus Methanofastidiosum sp.]|nr:hypothetical protein [Methanofastidiosum sp.]